MEYLIIAFLIFFVFDIYYRFRKTNENIFLLRSVALLVIKYEKILLKEKIINDNDIVFTRDIIKGQFNNKDFKN